MCEWYAEPGASLDEDIDEGYLFRMVQRWKRCQALRWARVHWARGGGFDKDATKEMRRTHAPNGRAPPH